jgi:poly(A) polymerase
MTTAPPRIRARWLRAPALTRIFAAIRAAGGEARVAGGAVRNTIMGLPVTEVDLATTLSPEAVTRACESAGLAVHPTGIDHGTVTVVSDHTPYEVTTLRHDVETDGRRARVKFTDDWQADAQRRDFTMNALYCDEAGKIYDFTEGYRDSLRKRIIFVGAPSQRIREDYLRILRFFRFHARFGSGTPDAAGLAACVRHRRQLAKLSAERIRQEMFKLLAAPGAVPTLKLMAKLGILGELLPYTEEWRVIGRLPPDAVLRLAVLAADPVGMKERWRLSNSDARRLIGAAAWRDLVQLAWARSRASSDDPAWRRLLKLPDRWQAPSLPVSGKDLIAAGLAPGPAMGEALRRLEDWWVASDFKPDRDALMARLRT